MRSNIVALLNADEFVFDDGIGNDLTDFPGGADAVQWNDGESGTGDAAVPPAGWSEETAASPEDDNDLGDKVSGIMSDNHDLLSEGNSETAAWFASELLGVGSGNFLIGMTGLSFTNDLGSAKGGNGGGGNGGKNGGGGGGDTGSGTGVLSDYLSGSNDGSGFNIEIVFKGTWTSALQQSFIDAADLLSTIITGDIQDVFFRGKIIDDVKIEAKLSDIDGTGGILGQAGPTAYRTADYLPAMGIMEFDVADAQTFDGMGLFNDIVFHEMMHVLGFGTMWNYMGLVDTVGDQLEFNGTNAGIAFAAEYGINGAPTVETDGGSGTAGGHWNEGDIPGYLTDTDGFDFGNEIMSGFINSTNYLSNTTIAALEDMGYETVFDPNNPLLATSGLDLGIFSDTNIV
ncbi:leishmanolysin-related zinc metalloendopeptidase [Roseibium sp.]|uniref:leishmanolysin-related zinc metalloendopeptidase n=1 Tax=Roseibium sp. TaxID=1936156 RepID=UPI003D0A8E06